MFYEKELRFLCDTFKKGHIRALVLTPNNFMSSVFNNMAEAGIGDIAPEKFPAIRFFGNLENRTMYKMTDSFKRCYIYFRLPETEKSTVLFIGPYLSASLSAHEILEIGEANKISPKHQRYLDEYYAGLPVVAENSIFFLMLDAFCERIWKSPSFLLIDVNKEHHIPASLLNESAETEGFDDIMASMKAMEKRYDFENELMQAVSLGQIHKEKHFSLAFSDISFEKRVPDPLRNAKNYSIIMNTLLRKAAENGGVHPIYIDRISAIFANKIENGASIAEMNALMSEMFRGYCRLVQQHSIKNFSLVVQKTIMLIDSDLSANLAPNILASAQNVSLSYLSTIFKKETGKTVSEYIREKRVKHAVHLLSTTRLQIQTIALHCGIMDVQYFSKIFKKQTGLTPKEYREMIKSTSNINIQGG